MRLVIGGCAQGKLRYVLQKYQLERGAVWDGVLPDEREVQRGMIVIDHVHRWIRCCLSEKRCPEKELWAFLERCGDCILICDEIGSGIVPSDAFERAYRECVGRILIQLAAEAEEVERVICGIGQKIK